MRVVHILLVEGKSAGALSQAAALSREGYQLHTVHTGRAALDYSKRIVPDLVVFDGASMRSSGVRSCRQLRRHLGDTVPIIHTRPSGETEDHLAGADIYLAQPFTARKLLNRVRALLPADDSEEEIVRAGAIILYRGKRSVEVGGQGERRLTPKLMALLEEFLRYPNAIISRPQLMQNVWKTTYVGDTRTLDVHIRWIREIIERDPSNPRILRTVRGKGYLFDIGAAGKRPDLP